MFSRRPTFFLRFAVCLLALLQGVAVSWHVCELGGPHGASAHCHPAAVNSAAPICHNEDDPTRYWRMTVESAPQDPGNVHCLAALLSTTPSQTSQSFNLSSHFEARVLRRETPQSHLCDAVTLGIDARGPPSA